MPAPHEILARLTQQPSRLVCGLMSGTSVDAVDAALVRISGSGTDTRAELVQAHELPFPDEARDMILNNAEVSTSTVSDVCVLRTLLAKLYAQAVRECCEKAAIEPSAIDLVGMHGQTLYHLPEPLEIAGYDIRSTFQCGNAPALAHELGVPVVSDFRSADMAAGGQGAPLVPYVDFLLYRSFEEHRILLNIGGIANLTWLPAGCMEDHVLAYDSGPGNIVLNALMHHFYGKQFDEGGAVARRGRLNQDLFGWMMSHPYFRKQPPKSTGREVFGMQYIEMLLEMARDFDIVDPEDIIATAAQMTVETIASGIEWVVEARMHYSGFVSGGGAKNEFFTEGLKHKLGPGILRPGGEIGINPDAKEAMCCAVLANEWLFGKKGNIPAVTGAAEKVLLGSLSLP